MTPAFTNLPIGRALISEDGQKLKRVISQPGMRSRHHIMRIVRDGYEFIYHATKGWRRSKL